MNSDLKKRIIFVLGAGTIYKLVFLKDAFYIPLQEEFHLTNTQIGNALSIYYLIATIGYVFAIYITDKLSKKVFIPAGLLASGLLGLYFALFPSYKSMLVIWGFLGLICETFYWPLLMKSITATSKKGKHGGIFSSFEMGRGIVDTGISFLGVGVFFLFGKGLTGLKAAITFFSLANIIVGILAYKNLEHDVIEIKEKSKNFSKEFEGVFTVLKNQAVWLGAFSIFSVYAVYCGITFFIPFLRNIYGLSLGLIGIYGVVNQYGLKIFSSPLGGYLADKKFHSPTRYLKFTFLLSIIFLIIFILLPHEKINIIFGILFTLAFGSIVFTQRAIYFAPLAELDLPKNISGSAMALGSLIGYLPGVFAYSLYGKILDTFYGIVGYKIIFACMLIFTILGFYTTKKLATLIVKE